MKVSKSTVTKVRIEGAPALDPIDVFLEDHAPKQGSVTIKCYGLSWTTYWGSMWEGLTVGQFFCEAPESYVIDRLWPAGKQERIPDYEALADKLRAEVCKQRRIGTMSAFKARDLFDECDSVMLSDTTPDTKLIEKIFDYCWWDHIPTKTNPDYDYLRRIVQAVRQALPEALTP